MNGLKMEKKSFPRKEDIILFAKIDFLESTL